MAKRSGTFWPTRQIISLFVDMGCEHNIVEEAIASSDGDCHGLSYLYNPDNGAHVAITDVHLDERISSWEVESWERRLGIVIPKPQSQ